MNNGSESVLLSGLDLTKSFRGGDGSEVLVLDQLSIEIMRHEVIAIVGSSGAGKSTLLQILGGLDRPTSGIISLEGESLEGIDAKRLAKIRNRHIGFVFQFHHLLKDFNALENVMMPRIIGGLPSAESTAEELLAQVGLENRMKHKPSELSGGEQQRVAVARALCNEPKLLLADEPSGNLDKQTSDELHSLLFQMRESCDLTMVIVTHSKKLAGMADRVVELRDGKLWNLEKGTNSVR